MTPARIETVRRMADSARRYADQCATPNQRVYLTRKPGKILPPGFKREVLDVADLTIDGHVVVFLRSVAWWMDEIAKDFEESLVSPIDTSEE